MLSRTIAVFVVSTTLLSVQAYAESPTPPPQHEVAQEQAQTPVHVDLTPAKELALPAAAGLDLKPPVSGASDVDFLNVKYLKGVALDTGKVVTAPAHWDSSDWLKVGAVVGVTGSLMLVDQKVKDFAQSHQSKVASKFAMVGNDLGNGLYVLPPVGAFYLYGYLTDNHKARRTALLALESYAVSGLMTEGLKMMAGRHRPNSGDSPTSWDGPHLKGRNVSFSSGHTQTAFSIATVFAEEYKDTGWVPPVAYTLATLTGLSRIYSNEHWASDVFFGGALGYFTSKMILKLHKEDHNSLLGNRLTLMPAVGKEMTGLSVKYDF